MDFVVCVIPPLKPLSGGKHVQSSYLIFKMVLIQRPNFLYKCSDYYWLTVNSKLLHIKHNGFLQSLNTPGDQHDSSSLWNSCTRQVIKMIHAWWTVDSRWTVIHVISFEEQMQLQLCSAVRLEIAVCGFGLCVLLWLYIWVNSSSVVSQWEGRKDVELLYICGCVGYVEIGMLVFVSNICCARI